MPGVASQAQDHWRQVVGPGTSARAACCQSPASTRTSTDWIPGPGDHATPATATRPAATSSKARGTSIREATLTGARSA